MKISYNWLRDLVDTSLAPRELASRLTNIGLAVDAVHEASDDFVLEFDLTSNRPDCLSHLGIARETAALEGKTLKLPNTEAKATKDNAKDFASVEVLDALACPRYAARVVRGVKVQPSPEWLANRLTAIGLRPINNIADITNYVMFEFGQPLHAFDLSKLTDTKIIVRRAKAGETIKALDGLEYKLDPEMLVIADAARPVAIAGVMGGEESAVYETAQDVLIESAYFDAVSVRRTSRALNLVSDSSYRFERGVDFEGIRRAQDRAVALICELAGGVATTDAIDVYPQKLRSPQVNLRFARVKALTGIDVAKDEALRILGALGFEKVDTESQVNATFDVPTWRTDVEIEEDLIEEVARLVGYDKITAELPGTNIAGEYRANETRRRRVGRALTGVGFDEAISFSFINSSHDGQFELLSNLSSHTKIDEVNANDDAIKVVNFIELQNPIIEGAARMRPTLLPGLFDAVRRNFNHGTRDVRLFETGKLFAARDAKTSAELPLEIEALGLVLTGTESGGRAAGTGRELDFYDLKGAIETVCEAMSLPSFEFAAKDAKHLRAGQSAQISLGGGEIGTLGRLRDEIAAAYKFKQPVFVAELDFSALLEAAEELARYTPLPRYPSIVRDISVLAARRVTFNEMRQAVLDLNLSECRNVALVDVYEGANLPEGTRSVTLRVEYRSDERTLRDEEVDALHELVVGVLEEKCGAKLRQ